MYTSLNNHDNCGNSELIMMIVTKLKIKMLRLLILITNVTKSNKNDRLSWIDYDDCDKNQKQDDTSLVIHEECNIAARTTEVKTLIPAVSRFFLRLLHLS